MKMRSRIRLLAAFLLLGGLAALVPWADRLWRHAWQDDAIVRVAAQRAELERRGRLGLARLVRKREIGQAVAQGRMPLLEAAARLGALNRMEPELPWRLYRDANPGATDEERFCREAISWAESELPEDDPCEAAAVLRRLEAELDRHLRRGGPRLPDVAEAPLAARD
jgi:hypothetical protein